MLTPRFSKVVGLRSAPEWVLSGTVSLGAMPRCRTHRLWVAHRAAGRALPVKAHDRSALTLGLDASQLGQPA